LISTITFDLWKTIFSEISYTNNRKTLLVKFLKERDLEISQEFLNKIYDDNFSFLIPNDRSKDYRHIHTRDTLIFLFSNLNIDICETDIVTLQEQFEVLALENPPSLKFGVVETLEVLHKDYSIGLISDTGITPGRIIKQIFDYYDILKYFEVLIFSDETSYRKPHPIAFRSALNVLNCLPQNAIHVGDLLGTDIKGAKDYGMFTIWVNNLDNQERSDITADYTIHQLPEVIKILKSLK